jgi:hypothetical protein
MKKAFRLGLLIMASILMSSCIKYVSTVNEDGSGTWEIALLLSADALISLDELGYSTDNNDEIIARMLGGESITDEQSGIVFTAEERLQNGSYWIYVTAQVNSPEDWAEIASAYERTLPNEDIDSITSSLLKPHITIDGDNIRVEVDLTFDEPESPDNFGNFNTFVQYSVEFILPGELVDHNGTIDSLTGNPVWVISGDSQEDAHFFAESRID